VWFSKQATVISTKLFNKQCKQQRKTKVFNSDNFNWLTGTEHETKTKSKTKVSYSIYYFKIISYFRFIHNTLFHNSGFYILKSRITAISLLRPHHIFCSSTNINHDSILDFDRLRILKDLLLKIYNWLKLIGFLNSSTSKVRYHRSYYF